MRARHEHGFTLIEMLVVTAIVIVVIAAAGTFFLAGTTPAVASAGRDVTAAFDEARRDAIAFDASTVVFAPAPTGTGYTARVYRRTPGDPQFAPRNGPSYDSTVTIAETAGPLGAPGFAFAVDGRGAVTGFANFSSNATAFVPRPCPASGAFVLRLRYVLDTRTVTIPCRLPANGGAAAVFQTPAPAYSPTPFAVATCPASELCALALVTPPASGGTCPSGTTADATTPGLCAVESPAPSSACPPGSPAAFPPCDVAIPSPAPSSPILARCTPSIPDSLGFASCIESNPVRILGPAITHASCGTRTPIEYPSATFTVRVEVWKDGSPWALYTVAIGVSKSAWLDFGERPPIQNCGLLFAIVLSATSAIPAGGNAVSSPFADTGDPAFAHQGVDAIVIAPLGGGWGSNT